MAIFRSFNDIVIGYIEFLRLVQPLIDSKPGTVPRNLIIDANAQQIANLYSQLRNIFGLQSLFSATGTDLNKLASNFNVNRSSGSPATGTAVFTTNSLSSDILIPQNTIITARSGVTFKTTLASTMFSASANVYKATASRLQNLLALASITDQYAIEVPVEALTPGISGNIGQFSLSAQNVPGISNITNTASFAGGTDQESDIEFRNRILSVFAGSNTGTSLGYITTIKSNSNVTDATVVEPGDPLMTRDGTQTVTDSGGNLIVTSTGTGGKVDIYVLGSRLASQIDTYIYNDKSGRHDATDPVNDFVLGQNGATTQLNIQQRRVQLLAAGTLPNQPVDNIISVTGSLSGNNFVPQFTASDGTIQGNYILEKDTGSYGGSPFGFDKLHWISNKISLSGEEDVKGIFNGQDPLTFSDVTEIAAINQSMLITNENSKVNSSNRSLLTLKHTPISSVSRIVNLTTGERYVITNQNTNGQTGQLNTTGVITIGGNTLPVLTDILQVDYTWVKPFDPVFDFDNLKDINTLRSVQDSVDWGFGDRILKEPSVILNDGYGNYTVTLTDNISKVIDVLTLTSENSTVSSGAVVVSNLVTNVLSIRRVSDNAELYYTDQFNGTISGNSIILPTDTLGKDGQTVVVKYNTVNLFSNGVLTGTFKNNVITLPNISGVGDGYSVFVDYITSVNTLVPTINLSSLPALQLQNNITVNGVDIGKQPTSNIYNISGTGYIKNLRRAASSIEIDCENIGGPGSISITGATFNKVQDVLITVLPGDGFTIDLTSAIQSSLGTSVSANIRVAKLYSVEKVTLNLQKQISSIDNVFDIANYEIGDNSYDLDVALKNASLGNFSVKLAPTTSNTANQLKTGQIIRVAFYYINTNDSDLLFYSRNGTQITQKRFSSIYRLSIGSGFETPKGIVQGTITVSNFNQPVTSTSYNTSYNYTAPKENERITINYNNNAVIDDATLSIEQVRPITADVLVKEATAIPINITVNVVLLSQYQSSSQTVQQNIVNSISSFLNSTSLGTTIDASDVVNNIYSVAGVDRVIVLNFSTTIGGNVQSIVAQKNQYLTSGTVVVNITGR